MSHLSNFVDEVSVAKYVNDWSSYQSLISAALMCDYLNYLLLALTDKHVTAASLRIPYIKGAICCKKKDTN